MQKTILVADDESHILNVVTLKLSNAGHAVITAVDGDDAFAKAQQHQLDMVISDYHMPGRDGLELCMALRRDLGLSIPAILLTARGNELTEDDLAAGGIVAVISKPFSPRQLLGSVDSALCSASEPLAGTT